MRVKKIVAARRLHPLACVTKFSYSNLEITWTDCMQMSPKRGMKYCRRHRYFTPELPANGDGKPCLRRDTKS
ncbi:hypothetical protein CBM2623_B170085 [Cupriavidus taiwanensis]|nr:hypothetical protein CBM2623_B170085 [Cupriavidus taiwanensis]